MTDLDVHLDAIGAGDAGAFGQWLARAEPSLRESLRSFARTVDTEAVVQETALTLWNLARAGRVRPDGRGNSLLRLGVTVARRRAIDLDRRQRRRLGEAAPGNPGEKATRPGAGRRGVPPGRSASGGLSGSGEPPDPRHDFSDPFLRERIRRCFQALRSSLRATLATFIDHAGSMTMAQMARQGGDQTAGAFRQNLSRARKAMAACLREHGVEGW